MTTMGRINRLRQYPLDHDLDDVDLVGSSFGGLVALHYAHRFGACPACCFWRRRWSGCRAACRTKSCGRLSWGLRRVSAQVDVLGEVLDRWDADQCGLVAHIAFGRPGRAGTARAAAFTHGEQRVICEHDPTAQDVVLALLDKCRVGSVDQMTDPRVSRLRPFREMGEAVGVIRRFGGAQQLQTTVREMEERLYPA